ncbi:MAG: FAD-dependent oxidoreductase [Geminicoccaceae bacterium]|nr:FAD-dependent oxidoreductase [Geminicoccaceae bacterium]
MIEVLHPDLCVIGGGAGGLALASGAAQLGASVVLVERDRLGGDCLFSGCVPSKALLAAARRAQQMREAGAFGIRAVEPDIDFAAVMEGVRTVIGAIAAHDSPERFERLGVRVLFANARFVNPREVRAGRWRIRARRFVIATGSRPALPAIPGLEDLPHFTTDTIFAIRERPGHLLVLGAGAVGCELAQAFRRLGTRVTLLDEATMLAREDELLVEHLRRAFREEGIVVRERAVVRRVEPGPTLVLTVPDSGEERVSGTHLLLATGRRPAIEDLDLEAAGIRYSAAGIAVDPRLRTSNPRVYAIGDCTGGPQFSHLAAWQAAAVARSILFRWPARGRPRALPRVLYTDPELAAVGFGYEEAKAAGIDAQLLDGSLADTDRARCERYEDGRIRVVLDRRGRILGCAILAPCAGELIVPWVLAIERKLPLSALARTIMPYPTFSEITKRAAASFFAPKLFSATTRRIVRLLGCLG